MCPLIDVSVPLVARPSVVALGGEPPLSLPPSKLLTLLDRHEVVSDAPRLSWFNFPQRDSSYFQVQFLP